MKKEDFILAHNFQDFSLLVTGSVTSDWRGMWKMCALKQRCSLQGDQKQRVRVSEQEKKDQSANTSIPGSQH